MYIVHGECGINNKQLYRWDFTLQMYGEVSLMQAMKLVDLMQEFSMDGVIMTEQEFMLFSNKLAFDGKIAVMNVSKQPV